MEEVPILSMDQIEQLCEMVKSIQQENRKDLDSILSESVDIQYTTIINLYNLTVEAWQSKQKTIDNICHFTLTMMNTVQYLWEKQYEQQDKLSNAQVVIGTLQRNIGELNEENKEFKNKMNQVEVQLNSVAGERDRIEELYRSASCIAFESEKQLKELDMGCKKCSACFEIKSQFDQEQSALQQKSSKVIEEKESQISSLREQNKRLQEEFEHLKEQHELTRLEMELAEIAIKDALTYKESYISMVSQIQDGSRIQPAQKLQKAMLRNCRSQPHQISCLNSHILGSEIPTNQEPEDLLGLELDTRIHKEEDSQLSLIKLDKKQEKKTTYQTPFRKKNVQLYDSENEQQESFDQSAIYNKDGVVIFQSNIDFTLSSNHESSKETYAPEFNLSPRLFCSTVGPPNHKLVPSASKKPKPSPTLRPKPYVPSNRRQLDESMSSKSSQTTINKLYNYISTKLVSSRIRRH